MMKLRLDEEATIQDLVVAARLKQVPEHVSISLVNFYAGLRPLLVLWRVPSSEEVLDMLASGHRCVSVLISEQALCTVYGHRDCLEMLLHDLAHMEHFVENGRYWQQVGFFEFLRSSAAPLHQGRWLGAYGNRWRLSWRYVSSDMNTVANHMLQVFQASLMVAKAREVALGAGLGAASEDQEDDALNNMQSDVFPRGSISDWGPALLEAGLLDKFEADFAEEWGQLIDLHIADIAQRFPGIWPAEDYTVKVSGNSQRAEDNSASTSYKSFAAWPRPSASAFRAACKPPERQASSSAAHKQADTNLDGSPLASQASRAAAIIAHFDELGRRLNLKEAPRQNGPEVAARAGFGKVADVEKSNLQKVLKHKGLHKQDAMPARIGFITDTEGNFDYWCRCVELSRVVRFDAEEQLDFCRSGELDKFVFGGDVFDKGLGDIRIASALVAFKRKYPNRVILLVGNRDLNKLRFTAELHERDLDVPQPVPLYPRAPPQMALRDYLEQRAIEEGIPIDEANNTANRLRWILNKTMTAQGAFEHRRQELSILRSRGSASDAGVKEGLAKPGTNCGSVSDEEVVHNFLDSVQSENGFVWQYLRAGQLAALIGNTLFVHGGVPLESLGWVPSKDMRYCSPQPGEVCGGSHLPAGHSASEWVDALNGFYEWGLSDFRTQMLWREDHRSRGGEALLCMTSTPACFSRSVMVESLLQEGMPTHPDPRVEQYLSSRGVCRVICGHKPCGDSPFVVKGSHVEFLHCDTTFSDASAPDKRGSVVAAVEVEGDAFQNYVSVSGVLRDGTPYNYALPSVASADTNCEEPPAKLARESEREVLDAPDALPDQVRSIADCDRLIGRRTSDGWWVKARLADASYHMASGRAGDRNVSYKRVTYNEAQAAFGLT
eukprot:TRINITY_DN15391_c0_g1_i1.p1 TRINITY_DN15391_c0_g1~~TRINITY_DN15391_c0_g1_i1.p1  ORF type:complete len:891 (+),score=144.56 TRINITY_DN15391_c0_g1_i1:586-3258(+)